ncbi:unnamed protein product [Bursaphelenchus xylophilus]|nr:unnamed protein product [Bursaphelenchus xylophilus]CAG9080925.1 unnamed protein product [Bursaphelenchus xylophilus]
MKTVCLVLIALAFATAVSAESLLYKTCKQFVFLESLEKKDGSCGKKYTEEQKRKCIYFEEHAKGPFPDRFSEVAIVTGLIHCEYLKCQLTEEYCERNKATFDRLSPQKQ